MNADATFERDLERWLEVEAAPAAPLGLHDDAISRAGGARQRPGWLVTARGGTFPSTVTTDARPGRRAVYLVVAIALLVVALVAALATGAFRSQPVRPLGGNGAIVFTVQGNGRTGTFTHRMDADGLADELIVAGRCPTYSADGRVLAWADYDDANVYLALERADARSSPPVGHEHQLLMVEAPPTEISFAISPDGTQVAWFKPIRAVETIAPDGSSTQYGFDAELWVAPAGGGPGMLLVPATGVPNEFARNPVWSPDGRRIAFERYMADIAGGRSHRVAVDVVDADGSNRDRLSSRPAVNAVGLSWSPDGRYLAYAALPDGTPIPSAAADDPAYRDPPLDIFVIGADGSGERNISNTSTLEQEPVWSPDGKRLAYRTTVSDEGRRLITVRMDGADVVGAPRIGPSVPWVVWSPDGTSLLVLEERPIGSTGRSSVLGTIDRDFLRPPTSGQIVDGSVVCVPSWQRVDP